MLACFLPDGIKTACIPLQEILDYTGLYDINLFSLDVEGAELAVLTTVDWSVTNFEVIVVELDASNLLKDQQVRNLLSNFGYESAAIKYGSIRDACDPGGECTLNEVFINPNFLRRKMHRKNIDNSTKLLAFGTGVRC